MTSEEFNTLQAGTSERDQQAALVEWAGYAKAERPALRLLFHVPNGGHRRKSVAARMKALGTRRGVPDLCLPVMREGPDGRLYGALWIEMKSRAGRLRKEQRWWRDNLLQIGHAHAVCRSWIEGKDVLVSYLDGRFNLGGAGQN